MSTIAHQAGFLMLLMRATYVAKVTTLASEHDAKGYTKEV